MRVCHARARQVFHASQSGIGRIRRVSHGDGSGHRQRPFAGRGAKRAVGYSAGRGLVSERSCARSGALADAVDDRFRGASAVACKSRDGGPVRQFQATGRPADRDAERRRMSPRHYCPSVAQTCLRWLDPETKLQCAQFDRASAVGSCPMPTQHKRFCVDRYEWPNKAGTLPQYMASWTEAKASCEGIGKRLCSDTEWTLACEGPERKPYPYGDGYVRDDRACNIDKPYIWPHPEKIFESKTQDGELARLDQREPSGYRKSCVSPYGVHDMVGNVDEWVVNESQAGKPFRSGLKGGYWGPVRTRCRPMTTAHDETFRYYQIGFRCCGAAHDAETGETPIVER